MSRRSVILYYNQVQSQYLEMLNDAKDFDEALKLGLVSQEQFDQAQSLTNKLKENYERLTYIIALLNEPNKNSKKHKYRNQNKSLLCNLENSSQEFVVNENADVLREFKKLIKEVKK